VLQTRILTTVRAIIADLPFLMHFSDIYHAHSTHLLIIIPSSVLLPCRRPMAATTCFKWLSQLENLPVNGDGLVFSQGIESWCTTLSLMYAGGKKPVFLRKSFSDIRDLLTFVLFTPWEDHHSGWGVLPPTRKTTGASPQ